MKIRASGYRSFPLAAGATQQDTGSQPAEGSAAQKIHPAGIGDAGDSLRGVGAACSERRGDLCTFTLANGTPTGYIADDAQEWICQLPWCHWYRQAGGIWESNIAATPALANFSD